MAELDTSGGPRRIGGAEEGKPRGLGHEPPAPGGNANHDGPEWEKARRGFFLRRGGQPPDSDQSTAAARDGVSQHSWVRVKDISMGAVITAIAVLATVTMISLGTMLRGALADFGRGSRPGSAVAEQADHFGQRVRSASEIQERIDRAAPGAIIEVEPGRYRGSIDFRGKALTVRGREGAARTVIEGAGVAGDLVTIRGAVGAMPPALEGFTLRGARGASSAALRIEECDPIISLCVIEDNEGGGAVLRGSRALVDECLFRRNRASPFGAGLQSIDGSPVIITCTFEQNHAMTGGGALYLRGGTPMIVRTRIEGNSTSVGAWGGGIYADSCDLTVMDCEIFGNGSSDEGGGVFVRNGSTVIERCDFDGNRSRSAWSLLSQGASVQIRSTRFCGDREWNIAGDGISERSNEFDADCGRSVPSEPAPPALN